MNEATLRTDDLTRIMRKEYPTHREIYNALEILIHQAAALTQAQKRHSSTLQEVVAKKRMDILLRQQLHDLEWKRCHPEIRQFILRHRWLRRLGFHILPPEEAEQVRQEVEIILEMPLFL